MDVARARAFEAVRAGDAAALTDLLAADPALARARDERGLSLLLQACYHKKNDLAEMIRGVAPPLDIFEAAALPGGGDAARGAELLAADPALAHAWSPDGFTPLHLAAFFGSEGMAGLLLAHGADPSAVARNTTLVQPIHSAVASRVGSIVAMLLDRGADVNARQQGGWTPLHAAAIFDDLPLVELLLSRGARADLGNDQGKTPLDIAAEQGHVEVEERLRSQADLP